jgi:hypothetical protein
MSATRPEPGSGLTASANGPACTARELREGVPLGYVSEKLRHAIAETHDAARAHPDARERLVHVMYSQTKALLALHNLLDVANAEGLPEHLLDMSRDELDRWVAAIVAHGDLLGAAQG